MESGERRGYSKEEKMTLYRSSRTCAICEQEIVEIDDAEVDHKIPYSAGGPTDMGNAQLTHRYCNRAKSGKVELRS